MPKKEKQDKLSETLGKILPAKLNKEILKIIEKKGIELSSDPEIIFKPDIKFKGGKVASGKITFEIKF
ncbi:MAG TPA: hypothetical protein PLJ39_02025 [Spirochaetota bacterium]|nr:hypothetical protein [Spirochaetota bacterium]HPN29486.1 hypothetical protein [bacterium]HPN29507.1 hypothetical protein [bacterium]